MVFAFPLIVTETTSFLEAVFGHEVIVSPSLSESGESVISGSVVISGSCVVSGGASVPELPSPHTLQARSFPMALASETLPE